MNITTLLNGVVATGAGAAFSMVSRHKAFQIDGITTATVVIYGANTSDQTKGISLGSVTADGSVVNDQPWAFVWADVTAWTAGTITITVATPNAGA